MNSLHQFLRLLLFRLFAATLFSALAFAQGVIVPPQTALKTINGVTMPIAGATITVCAVNTGGIPCSPALSNAIFRDAALTQPLTNPFFADVNGNYNFAIAPGNYTVTVTALGFSGYSYQISAGNGTAGAGPTLQTNGSNNTLQSLLNLVNGSGIQLSNSGGQVTIANTGTNWGAVGAGSNPNLLTMASGGALSPLNTGQIAGSQLWMLTGLPAASASCSNSGGSILNGHAINLQYSLVDAAGETLPSVITLSANQGCSGNSQSVTVTAPTIPSGYTGYTVYANDQTVDALYHKQTASNACVNITGNCVIQSVSTSSQPLTIATAYIQPPNVQANNSLLGSFPSAFFPKADGNYYPWLNEDWQDCDSVNGPPLPCGTPLFSHRTYFSDLVSSAVQYPGIGVPYKNSFIAIDHRYGVGTTLGNQDRGLGMLTENFPATDTSTYRGLFGIQQELDINGAPTITGGVDANVIGIQAQISANNTSNVVSPAHVIVLNSSYFQQNGGGYLGGSGLAGVVGVSSSMTNNSTTPAGAGTAWFGFESLGGVGTGVGTNISYSGYTCKYPTFANSFGAGNICLYIPNASGWSSPRANDAWLRNEWTSAPGLPWQFDGPIFATSLTNPVQQTFPVNASVAVTGSLATSQIASSWTTGYSSVCSGGSSVYTYQFVAVDANGGSSPSAALNNCINAANPLTSGNPATLSAGGSTPTTTVMAQAVRIDVYRTGGPMATGKIGSLTCNWNLPIYGCLAFTDTGLTADGGTIPSVNTTGGASFAGFGGGANTVRVTADFTSAANTSLQTITGLTWNLLPVAKNYSFHCSLLYSQATAAAAMQFGIQAATVNPTSISAKGRVDTSASAQTTGNLIALATTTATAIVTFTPSASATVFGADLDGTVENPANDAGQVLNIMVQTSNSADLPTIKKDSYCNLMPAAN